MISRAQKMKFSTRNASIKDAISIAELSDQLGYKSEVGAMKNRLIKILGDKNHCALVALDQEKVVGWIHAFYTLRIESEPFVEIGGLVVNAKYRKQGIGKLLVGEINLWASSKQCVKVRVRCNIIRKETHLFYQKIGFEIDKEQKVFDQKINNPKA